MEVFHTFESIIHHTPYMSHQLLSFAYKHDLINAAELEKIIAAHTLVTFSKGDFILTEGKVADAYYILESGLMRSYVYDYNADDITTDFFRPSDVVIEVLSLFQRVPAKENIQALTDCTAWKIDFETFQSLYHSIPGFSEWGRLWMTHKLFEGKQRSLDMITSSAKDRYEHLLKEKPEIVLQSPLKYIASYLGITDSSFSRIRKEIQ